MKHLFFVCCLATNAFGQDSLPTVAWGTWGLGNLGSTPAKAEELLERFKIKGYHLYYNWSDLEPSKGDFRWAPLDEKLQDIADHNLLIGLQIMVGQNSPAWIYNNVPEVVTAGGSDPGPYPYYFDPDHEERYLLMLKTLANHLAALPVSIKTHLYYWQIAEGSTGDEQPYKGTPIDPAYEIDEYDWQDYKHRVWDSVTTYAGNYPPYKFLFNTGNIGQDLGYVEERFPGALRKEGFLSHEYSFDGELLYYIRQLRDVNQIGFRNRSRGEVQGVYNYPWWQLAPVKQAFTLACSALSGGLDMMNVGAAYANAIQDTRPTEFFTKYGGLRNASISDRGFIALRDVPDFADTIRFPVDQYGNVIDPARRFAYAKRIYRINNNEKDSAATKYWKKMKAMKEYLNPARRDMIVQEFAPAGAMYNDDGDGYHNDFGINMTKDFARYIRQVSPDSTSIGAWRIGPDSSIFGRYARMCKLDNNRQGEMFFIINPNIETKKKTLEISIVYYDTGRGTWSLNGSHQSFLFKNKNTNKWLQQVVTIDNFKSGTLLDGRADFSIRHLAGGNNPFTLIEVRAITPAASGIF